MNRIEKLIFTRQHRVVLDAGAAAGDSTILARQFDAALMEAGFKASGDLLAAMCALEPGAAMDKAVQLLGWARELAGGHVDHLPYFASFPRDIPDTAEFWAGLIADAIELAARTGVPAARALLGPGGLVAVDLLSLPGYGRPQHTFSEMLARHDELIPALSDRLTVLHLGGSLAAETGSLFAELAGSTVPLSGPDLAALRVLAEARIGEDLPLVVVRENLAVVNAARIRAGAAPAVGTVTDVLRLAAELSGGDVTLQAPVRFRSLPRRQRAVLLAALDGVVTGGGPGVLGDVPRFAEPWKRVGERLHPHEFGFAAAARVFAVARGELPVVSRAGRVERAFTAGEVAVAAGLLAQAPGMLWRSADRLLRTAGPGELAEVVRALERTAPDVSGRVLLGVREHFTNRLAPQGLPRIFVNRRGRAFVAPDRRAPVDAAAAAAVQAVVDAEIAGRLPDPGRLVIDRAVLGAALPLTGKAAPEGLGVWPRGSVTPVDGGDVLRLFAYWRQASQRTDYDLSAVFLDPAWRPRTWLSYTSLRGEFGVHSGDITDAPGPGGASEFIDVDLAAVPAGWLVVPQVYVFAGERFDRVAESFFGFMTRDHARAGQPYELTTVRYRSGLHTDARVAMPLACCRGEDGRWYAKWLHLYLPGRAEVFGGARVEENKATTALQVRAMMSREYLRAGYLAGLLEAKATTVASWPAGGKETLLGPGPVTYLGVEEPDGLPGGSEVYTLSNLAELIPA